MAGGAAARGVDPRRLRRRAGVLVRRLRACAGGLGTARVSLSERVLNRTTLLRQSLLERSDDEVATVIGRLAGIQAQHANAPHVALWSRIAGFESSRLERALEARSVVRATTIRSTLHLETAEDYPAFDAASLVPRIE